MALVTGGIIAAGYWYLMSATMNMAMNQVNTYQQQYEQAVAMTEQLATNR